MPKGIGNKDLGEFIRLRRVSLGISRSDAAAACQLDRSYWNKLENAYYHQPAPNLLQRIAQLLQVAPDDLYTLAGYAIPKSLPTFRPYLRAKYDLPPEAIADLERYFDLLRTYYGIAKEDPVFPPKVRPEHEPSVEGEAAPEGRAA
jgi:transcriptional regulator with XRE-family HTH domain